MREDLIKSAVSFLSDPKVQSAPLAKKVSFLESKGMTSEEIEEAMSRVSGKAPSTPAAAQTAVAPYTATSQQPGAVVTAAAPPPPPIPPRPKYDWRDIFIAAVLAGGVGYGIWTLAKRVFGPWFKVPTEEQLEKDKQALDEQFQAVEDSLKEIKDQTQQALTSVSAQSDKVKDSLTSLEAVLEDLKKGDEQRDEEFRNVKGDIDALKEMVPKMLDRNKEAQNRVLEELQNELKSLKSLILSRRPQSPAVDGSSSPSENGLTSRLTAALNGTGNAKPGIPAWQQAAAATTKPTTSSEAEPAAASSPSSSAAAAAATNSNSEAAEASQEKQ